jgi:precorrin-2/cobalt-factor-2 C20-methyltransferase
MSAIGTLYGLGVGPGDPELLTLKAARVLREVQVVFAAGQARSGKSLALEIASPHLAPGAEVVVLPFDHTFASVEDRRAHREHARRVLDTMERPAAVAFLTLGDPMTYSTFTYLLEALRELRPALPVEVVPGVTSYSAAAASGLLPLVEGNESLSIVSAAQGTDRVESALSASENVVVLKAYRRAGEVCDLLATRGLAERTLFSAQCSQPGGLFLRDLSAIRELSPRYMSLFLVKGGPLR